MSFTYAQLKQAIQDYTENDETILRHKLAFVYSAGRRAHFKERTA